MRLDDSHEAPVNSRGFTLVEMLVAALVATIVAAALASVAISGHAAFQRSLAAGELTARARAALHILMTDLRNAGTGVMIDGGAGAPMTQAIAVALPARSLEDPRLADPFTAVTITRAAEGGGQSVLREAAAAGSTSLAIDSERPCFLQHGACGFVAGDLALLYDALGGEFVSIAAVNATTGMLTTGAPLARAFESGAIVAAVRRTTYGIRAQPDGSNRLVRISTAGAEQPLIDHVTTFRLALAPAGADPRTARRIDLLFRIEAAAGHLRGPAGVLFQRGGTAATPHHWVRDLELSASVALRHW
jgi:prepilin-type N-terminal cleavage/methylation domain-containing protein